MSCAFETWYQPSFWTEIFTAASPSREIGSTPGAGDGMMGGGVISPCHVIAGGCVVARFNWVKSVGCEIAPDLGAAETSIETGPWDVRVPLRSTSSNS